MSKLADAMAAMQTGRRAIDNGFLRIDDFAKQIEMPYGFEYRITVNAGARVVVEAPAN